MVYLIMPFQMHKIEFELWDYCEMSRMWKKERVVYFRSQFLIFHESNEEEHITLKTVDTRSKLETVSSEYTQYYVNHSTTMSVIVWILRSSLNIMYGTAAGWQGTHVYLPLNDTVPSQGISNKTYSRPLPDVTEENIIKKPDMSSGISFAIRILYFS